MSSTHIPDSPVIRVVEETADITALDLEGEFDLDTALALLAHSRRVLDAGSHLIVNLSDATFIDSSFVHALFTADAAAKSVGRRFVLQFGTHTAVERVLAITGVRELLQVAGTRDQAVGLIAAGGASG